MNTNFENKEDLSGSLFVGSNSPPVNPIGYNGRPLAASKMEELLNRLERLGFYQNDDPSLIPTLKKLSISQNSPWLSEKSYQLQSPDIIDAEDIWVDKDGLIWLENCFPKARYCCLSREDFYESIDWGFQEMQPILANYGVNLSSIDARETFEGDYFVTLNGVDYLVCPGEMNSFGVYVPDVWNLAMGKALAIMNNLLDEAKSLEKIYVVKEEDEDNLYFAFLTPEMNELISNSSSVKDEDKPVQVEEYFANSMPDNLPTSEESITAILDSFLGPIPDRITQNLEKQALEKEMSVDEYILSVIAKDKPHVLKMLGFDQLTIEALKIG